MSGVSETTLRAAMGAPLPLGKHPTLVADFNAALVAANCTTVRRAAMFCAQVGHESLGLRYFAELWGPTKQQLRYEPGTSLAKQLGNTQPGDGKRFMGRGPIQLTGRGGYATFLAWCRAQGYRPPDFLRDPGQVATSRWGFLAASHYWTVRRPGLNAASDRGSVEEATRLVNGGQYGLDDRKRRYQACLRLGDRLLPAAPARPAEEDDMTPEQDRMLREVHKQLFGPWVSWGGDGKRAHTLVDLTRQVENAETRALEFSRHHGATTDNQFGHTLSIRKEVVALRQQVQQLADLVNHLAGPR